MHLISVFGLLTLLAIAWVMSDNKQAVRPRIVIWGVGMQLLFAMIILSQSFYSLVGLFILLSMIILFNFREELQLQNSTASTVLLAGALVAGSAALSGLFYALDGFGLTSWALIAAVIALVAGSRTENSTLSRAGTITLLTATLGMLWAREIHGRIIFQFFSEKVDSFLKLTDLGTGFLFGNLVKPENIEQFGFQFALAVLPTIIFFAAFMAILYYFGIIQVIVQAMARFMRWTLGTSGAETLSCSANVFVGQTEAPLLIKPFLETMTKSELATIMVGGFATIAGGVLAGYIRMGVDPGHLIAASVMSAPAALVIGKIIFPETEHSQTAGDVEMPKIQTAGNVLEAASNGIIDGLKLAANVAAMLVGFIALIGFVDVLLNFFDSIIDGSLLGGSYYAITKSPFSPVTGEYAGIFPGSLKTFFGNTLRYLAFIMGVPWQDSAEVGNLLGLKLAVNEFVAFGSLGEHIKAADLSPRAVIISTYALCGFANFASIGIQIGGIGALAPSRRKDLAKVGLKAMIGGAIASWMTATIAGMIL